MRVNILSFAALTMALLAMPAAQAAEARPSHKKAAAPKFIPNSSQETTRERERRLLRECKGRPNAGACAGYAR